MMIGTKILESRKSKFNDELRVLKTLGMGTYIQSDGLTQSGGIVESIWSQTLKRINNDKLIIKNCLILGLGGGTVVKLIKKYWPKAKITGVDIDPVIIELGKKYLGLDLINIDIKTQDAAKPVTGKFDLVLVDLYKGDKFPEKFESEKFLKSLTKNKLVVFNRLTFKGNKNEALKFGKKLHEIFSKVEYYYPVTNLMFFCQK